MASHIGSHPQAGSKNVPNHQQGHQGHLQVGEDVPEGLVGEDPAEPKIWPKNQGRDGGGLQNV